ncbi:NEDD8-conjugating enzyme ubc12-like [Patiria miniata]|uniref:UBC core domain-containing protein n=1 Tax=Patiria miniata TaxID=46514 RepID=A0A913Z298_PATMI|nr:NEDD8-conjugating enzyme ubc12-like [Patiria miniata]
MAIEGRGKGQAGLAKDFHRLMKNIAGMSGGQARLVEWDETDLKKGISVSVIPDSGLYKDGEFIFSILCGSRYPQQAPEVCCKTYVYHPNIENDEQGSICLSMLDDEHWSRSMTLEDVVQGILFLMHNPNLEDPLNTVFNPCMDEEEFADNVRLSLEGGILEGFDFHRNRVVRGEGGAIATDEVGVKEDGVVVADGGGYDVTNMCGERNAGDEVVITDGGTTKEGGALIIDEGRVKERGDVTTDEGEAKKGEVVDDGGGTREGEVVTTAR